MAAGTKVTIQVKGENISPISSLIINQQFNDHHYFEITFDSDVIEEKFSVLINKSKDFLGEEVTISLSEKSSYAGNPDNVFKGIITDIGIVNAPTSGSRLVFKGYSPTILMEGGEHNASFSEKSLSQIVKSVIANIPGNVINSTINPSYKSSIPFAVQYRESNFYFTRRLAAQYGEWFFYDGAHLYFGKPSGGGTIKLNYPIDISSLQLNVKIAPLNFQNTAYYSKEDSKFSSPSSGQSVSGLDSFGTAAQSASNKLFSKPANALSLVPVQASNDLDTLVNAQKSSLASGMVGVHAACWSPYIKLGSSLTISAFKMNNAKEDYGKYIVTSVVHSVDSSGIYSNVFDAIPDSLKVVPNPFYHKSIAEPQLGVVKSTDDPDHLGKVKVQLLWQKDSDTTPFIRVMMPHAGMRDGNKKNRGFFFTPEEGDYVIVGFHQNDPDRPFVMGSLPSGKAIDTSMNSDNDAKAIRTRSGNTIYFYDKENSKTQQIRIETDEKNYISINVPNGKGAIQIYSTDTIELQSETSITITSKDITIKASDNIELDAQKDITIKAGNNLTMNGVKISAQASSAFEAKGMQVNIEGTTAAVKGDATLDLEGGAMTTIKGGMVMIN